MGDSAFNNNSGNLANAIKGPTKSDGDKPGDFRDWRKRLAAVLSVARREVASLIRGKPRPTEETTGTGAQASFDRVIADYSTCTCRDGQRALQELVNKYNKESSKIKAGSNDEAKQKWCSVHKTTSHDDSERYPPQSHGAVLSAISPPVNDDEKPSASNLLEEDTSSTTTAGASSTGAGVSSLGAGTPSPRTKDSSSGTGTPSSETRTLPQQAGVSSSSSGATSSFSPWDASAASPGGLNLPLWLESH